MTQKELDEASEKEKREAEEGIPQDMIDRMQDQGFEEKEGKPGLYYKSLGANKACFWDFRKEKKGSFYVTIPEGYLSRDEAQEMDEYLFVRGKESKDVEKKKVKKPLKGKLSVGKPLSNERAVTLRGTEDDIISLMSSIRLDSIIEVASDKLGEGVLYHDLGPKIGLEPSASAIDMISADMGNIETDLVEIGMHRIIDEDGDGSSYLTYYAVVKATDKATGTTGLGAAEEIIDFEEMGKSGRTFSRTKAIR